MHSPARLTMPGQQACAGGAGRALAWVPAPAQLRRCSRHQVGWQGGLMAAAAADSAPRTHARRMMRPRTQSHTQSLRPSLVLPWPRWLLAHSTPALPIASAAGTPTNAAQHAGRSSCATGHRAGGAEAAAAASGCGHRQRHLWRASACGVCECMRQAKQQARQATQCTQQQGNRRRHEDYVRSCQPVWR